MNHNSITTETSSETSASRCPHCGREYPIIRIPGLFGRDGRAIRSTHCGCDGERMAEEEEARRELQTQLTTAWHGTGVPEEFWDVSPDFDRLGMVGPEQWLYMHGPKGTGKTTAACRVLKAFVRKYQSDGHVSARFVDLPDWLASMRRWGDAEEDAYQRAAGVRMLVLDDLGKGKPTDWAMERVFRLINDRYKHRRPTIITSQYDLGTLGQRCAINGDIETAEGMVSRIGKRGMDIRFDGPDLRLIG